MQTFLPINKNYINDKWKNNKNNKDTAQEKVKNNKKRKD